MKHLQNLHAQLDSQVQAVQYVDFICGRFKHWQLLLIYPRIWSEVCSSAGFQLADEIIVLMMSHWSDGTDEGYILMMMCLRPFSMQWQ